MEEIRKFRWLRTWSRRIDTVFFTRSSELLPASKSAHRFLKAEESFIFLRAKEKEEGKDSVYLLLHWEKNLLIVGRDKGKLSCFYPGGKLV